MNVESMKEMESSAEMRPERPQRNYPAQERKRLLRLFEPEALGKMSPVLLEEMSPHELHDCARSWSHH